MSEASASVKIEGAEQGTASYTIKKWQLWFAVLVNVLSIASYVLYREFNYDAVQADHEKRIVKLEGNINMIVETKLNLEQFLTKQGYTWIKIPQPDK